MQYQKIYWNSISGSYELETDAGTTSAVNVVYVNFEDFDGIEYSNTQLNFTGAEVSMTSAGYSSERVEAILAMLNEADPATVYVADIAGLVPGTYSTVYVGKYSGTADISNVKGISETTGETAAELKNDNAFVFTQNIGSDEELAQTILHESGHLAGTLTHDNGGDGLTIDDFMAKRNQDFTQGQQGYIDSSGKYSDWKLCENCTFHDITNVALTINYNVENGQVKVKTCTFTNNICANNSGAAIKLNYGADIYLEIVTSSKFIGNRVDSGTKDESGNVTYTTIEQNGGAVYIAMGTAKIEASTFENNEVKIRPTGTISACGGAVFNKAGATTTLNSVTFTGNTVSTQNGFGRKENIATPYYADGGAVFNAGSMEINGGTFTKNATQGSDGLYYGGKNKYGGVDIFGVGGALCNTGTVTITGSIFDGNTVTVDGNKYGHGGAIYNTGTMTIDGGNFLTSTDTVYNIGTLTLKGNITTAAELNLADTLSGNSLTYNGTAKAEDAAITLDYSADNKAGYISNLAAFSDGSTYTLSALLADNVTKGTYTLAGGASSYADTITVKNSTKDLVSLKAGETTASDGIIYSLAVNDSAELVLTVTDKLVLSGDISDEKGNYTNTTGASVEVDGANITNNLYAAVSGDATLTVTSGEIKNIFAGAKFELGDGETASTGDITATVGGGGDITTTRIYGGNAVLGGTVETVNTTLTISGSLIAKDSNTGVWCYGAGIAASQTKDGTTTSGTLKITGTSKVEVTATGSVGSIVGGGRAQGTGSLDVNATSVTIGSSATVTNAIGGAYNSGSGSVSVGTAEMSISSQNVTTVFGGNFIAPVSDGVLSNVNSIDNVKLTINGAVASNAIFGGNYMKAGTASIENVKININGADSACGIYGGGFIVGAAIETITNVNITVSGKVEGNIFAGACVSGEGGSSTVTSANITVEAGSDVTGNIYAGGYSVKGTATVKECTITFSGNQSYFNYNGKVCAASAGSVKTAAPQATVVFDKYVGDFGGAFAGTFGVIEFTADSSVNFASKDFDGLKTNAVQITGMDASYDATKDWIFFDLADSCSLNIEDNVTVNGGTLKRIDNVLEGAFTYYWNNTTKSFGYAGAEAIANFKDKDSCSFYQLTAIA